MKTSETQTESSKTNHSFAQTEPTIPKMYNDSEVQTETVNETENEGDSSFFLQGYSLQLSERVTEESEPVQKEYSSRNFQDEPVDHYKPESDHDSEESDPELSPEELRNLLEELNRSTRKESPNKSLQQTPMKPMKPAQSDQSIFLRNLAPSYGLVKLSE